MLIIGDRHSPLLYRTSTLYFISNPVKLYGYSISLSVLSASSFMRADILLEEE
jgi:hypothetical protein